MFTEHLLGMELIRRGSFLGRKWIIDMFQLLLFIQVLLFTLKHTVLPLIPFILSSTFDAFLDIILSES